MSELESGKRPTDSATTRKYCAPKLTVHGKVLDLTAGPASGGAEGANSKRPAPCDRRTKENIARVGRHPLGFDLYLFEYREPFRAEHGSGRHFGPMADEVRSVMPQAISVGSDGYLRVDHGMLGIETFSTSI